MAKRSSSGKKSTIRDRVIETTLSLIAEKGFRATLVEDVIKACGVTEAEFYHEFDGLLSVLVAASRHLNAAMMDAIADFEEDDSTRERLFALVMARFDAATPWRAAIRELARSAPTNPVLAATAGQALMTMSARALRLAGVRVSGPFGFARVNGFMLAVLLPTARIWLQDESADLSKTMAALNEALDRAERLMDYSRPFCTPFGGSASSAEPAPVSSPKPVNKTENAAASGQ
ncbi:hypothetical protein GCM10007972_20120 [Iodidimonas muriae]|uniref:HTH tetR-type domain-containing protein n=1 Tax=Iodidimonas muriae TaxID=261467 RepID=A0ABQ2LEK5_9PROT|nr:TetR/AcrR family transcriptional regulator [Iodidimonas muriae]GER07622.1 hypothetical protein JCM17843_19320 [Kordiimonadales bacterium JCM 17843]GGO13682.1 hypothetical protein GCM10007972_20120 [Iodidimonas muriae]